MLYRLHASRRAGAISRTLTRYVHAPRTHKAVLFDLSFFFFFFFFLFLFFFCSSFFFFFSFYYFFFFFSFSYFFLFFFFFFFCFFLFMAGAPACAPHFARALRPHATQV